MKADRVSVVIRWFPILKVWGICHATSYQNVFRCSVFDSRESAAKFAEENNCTVEWHEHDQLQQLQNRG